MKLGWRVSSELSPIYWKSRAARPGDQGRGELVEIPVSELKHHTLIIAGSGAGKSYFLGRLLEELVLETKRTEILVLDPNSDFRRFGEVRPSADWKARRDDGMRLHLMTEPSRASFASRWIRQEISVRVGDSSLSRRYHRKQVLPWLKVAPELISEDLDPALQHDVFHCHELLREIVELCELCRRPAGSAPQILDNLLQATRTEQGLDGAQELLAQQFRRPQRRLPVDREAARRRLIARAESRLRSIDERVEHYYASRLRRYQQAQQLTYMTSWPRVREKVRVVDLASIEDPSLTLMVVNAELERIWNAARSATSEVGGNRKARRPFVVVIDEAHNLIPAQTDSRSVATIRTGIRRIVAEGRKYGLYVVLASQRPEKLDDQVVAECQNLALMRLPSTQAAQRVKQKIPFDDRLLPFEATADFRRGLVAAYGRWATKRPLVFDCAGRRTIEGGMDVEDSAW